MDRRTHRIDTQGAFGACRLIRLVNVNQRGGSGKTSLTTTSARSLAERGLRVLIVDADPQGSVSVILGLKPKAFLYDFVIEKLALRECLVSAHPRIDVLCGNRKTTEAEAIVMGLPFREFIFEHMLSEHEKNYDVVLMDVGPSISLFQTCAMVYAQRILVPVDMDILSVQGATACIHAADTLNRMLGGSLDIRILGLLPVKLNRRLAITEVVLNTLESISERRTVPILEGIRTDQSVVKAARARQFLADYDPKSKALEDYEQLTDSILNHFRNPEVIAIDAKTA